MSSTQDEIMCVDGYCTISESDGAGMDAQSLLIALDEAQVHMAVIAATDRELAVDNRHGNERIANAAQQHPQRFISTCSVNPWYGKQASEELSRAIQAGAEIVVFHPAVQGFSIDDEMAFPLYDLAQQTRTPVYVHTGLPQSATPLQIALLARKFSDTAWIMGHCGATDFWNDVPVAAALSPNVYLESSFSRPFIFEAHLSSAGFRRGIVGSSAPLNPIAFEWRQMRALLAPEDHPEIYGKNLIALTRRGGKP